MKQIIFFSLLSLLADKNSYAIEYINTTSQEPAKDLTAENMMLWQRFNGGWPKDTYNVFFDDGMNPEDPRPPDSSKPFKVLIDYTKEQTPEQKKLALDTKGFKDATIDNNHTVGEIRYLLKAYHETKNETYRKAAEKGVEYLLAAQYSNGGWPQFYPNLSSYKHCITYNDNAMMNVMNLLYDIVQKNGDATLVDPKYVAPADVAIKKGVDIILKTQVRVSGRLTVWCAQHDEKTLEPAKARAYELPSLSGSESVGIVQFLMLMNNPSTEIKEAINNAIAWFVGAQIKGYKIVLTTDATQPTGRDRILVKDSTSVLWARFYDLDTNKPFFCDRDGIKKNTLAEIGNERRAGYMWYGTWPAQLIEVDYPKWKNNNK